MALIQSGGISGNKLNQPRGLVQCAYHQEIFEYSTHELLVCPEQFHAARNHPNNYLDRTIDQLPFPNDYSCSREKMSAQQQRRDNDDAVRNAFREQGPYPRRWSLSDEDLEAYLDADYDTSEDNESIESAEPSETDPLLAAGNRTTFTPSSHDRPIRSRVLESYYYVLEPRQRRRRSPPSNIVGPKCAALGCVVFILVLLGIIYLGSPVLRSILFPEEQGTTSQFQALT